jgi:hypothetical protein
MLLRTSTITACVLALSGGAALAQVQYLPAAGGSTGTGTVESIGTTTPNADQAAPGTNSTSVLSHTNKAQSAAGAPHSNYTANEQSRYAGDMAAAPPYGYGPGPAPAHVPAGVVDQSAAVPNQTYIVDEYGRHYNRWGQRIR